MRQLWRRTGKRWIFHKLLPIVMGGLVVCAIAGPWWDPSFPADGSRIIALVLWSGITAMVVVETVKRLIPLRGFNQRRETGLWLQRRDWQARRRRVRAYSELADVGEDLRKNLAKASAELDDLRDQDRWQQRIVDAEKQISDWEAGATKQPPLATAGPPDGSDAAGTTTATAPSAVIDELLSALNIERNGGPRSGAGVGTVFNLPAEQLAAQISGAVEAACQEPATYRRLLDALDAGPRGRDSRGPGTREADHQIDAERAMRLSQGVDELQIHLAGRWRFYVRATTWWLAAVIGCVLAMWGEVAAVHTRLAVAACLIFGGFVAWTTRDLIAVVERARR